MDEVNLMLYNVKFNNKNTTEDALNFHRNNLKNDENVCIVTSLSDVNKQFDSDGIDNYIDLIKNISRNFNNKPNMRDIVVNRESCSPLVPVKKEAAIKPPSSILSST